MSDQEIKFKNIRPNADNPGVDDIEPRELFEHRDQVILLDVRQPEEFTGELGHIPGARLMVLNSVPEQLGEIDPEATVVFICRSGARSGRAAAFAREQGLSKVYNLRGGMLLWNELGLTTATGEV